MKKVRIDKWLWSVRIYKSRSAATDACKAGKIKIDRSSLKPSYMITVGEIVEVKKRGFNFQYKVEKLIDKRVSAILAAPCYTDLTPEEELIKYESWFIGKGSPEKRERGLGRPSKKERRELDGFKDKIFE